MITLSLTACMGGVAVAATLQTALFPGAVLPSGSMVLAADKSGDAVAVAEARSQPGRATPTDDVAGQVLPLPALDVAESDTSAQEFLAGTATDASLTVVGERVTTPARMPAPAAGSAARLPSAQSAVVAARPFASEPPDHDDEAMRWPTADWRTVEPAGDAPPLLEAEHVVVQRGDTLLQILLRSGIDRAEAHEVVGTLSTLYDPRRLRVGQAMAVEVERAGDSLAAPRLAALSLNLDFGNDLRVERDANGDFAARRVDRELVQTVHAAHAVIETSLYQTARRHAVPDEALVNLANIFSWDLDFQRDVHPGDSFEIVYEQVESPDGEVRGGDVLFASLKLRGRQVHAYRYEHSDGTTGYFDADGRSLRKWLMRTPIDGARLSSGFGPRRHPILGYNRMHRGVDFAAPTGTPIYAAGDGVITRIGRNGAYGNYIQVRHNGEFSSAYAHMSRFADGLKNGSRVRQGQVIAYVGSTGRSTGPHLHYEVLQNGQQINPMSIKPQTAARLAGVDLERFRRQIETIDARRPAAGPATTLAQR